MEQNKKKIFFLDRFLFNNQAHFCPKILDFERITVHSGPKIPSSYLNFFLNCQFYNFNIHSDQSGQFQPHYFRRGCPAFNLSKTYIKPCHKILILLHLLGVITIEVDDLNFCIQLFKFAVPSAHFSRTILLLYEFS